LSDIYLFQFGAIYYLRFLELFIVYEGIVFDIELLISVAQRYFWSYNLMQAAFIFTKNLGI